MRIDRIDRSIMTRWVILGIIATYAVGFGLIGLGVYVAMHFILKWW